MGLSNRHILLRTSLCVDMSDDTDRPASSRRRLLATVGVAAVAGCSGGDGSRATPETDTPQSETDTPQPDADPASPGESDLEAPTESPQLDVQIETLVENLKIPWDVAFTGSGGMYVTERTGRVLRYDSGGMHEVLRPKDVIDTGALQPGSDEEPWWVDGGEGGVLGVAAHPQFSDRPYLYVYYTARTVGGKANRVVRYDLSANDPAGTEETIVGSIPANKYHNGGRIRFGPDGNLWVCTGDAGAPKKAQDPSFLGGKVLRVTPEGDAQSGNPDLGGDPRVFAYGHRNPQGIDWLPGGVPVVNEHGPSNRDEVSVLVSGGNYGWNTARGGPEDEEWDSYASHDEFVPPVINTGPGDGWAPSGSTFFRDSNLSSWNGRYVVGGLISQSIWVVTLTPADARSSPADDAARQFGADWLHPDYTATAHRVLEDQLGRVRLVTRNPDGEVYAITSNRDGRARGDFPRETDDILVRLSPA